MRRVKKDSTKSNSKTASPLAARKTMQPPKKIDDDSSGDEFWTSKDILNKNKRWVLFFSVFKDIGGYIFGR